MKGSIIHNTGSAVTVQLPSGEKVPALSVIEALDMVASARSLQQEGFGQINTLDYRTDAEKTASGLKISRIDLQARLGDDGEHYDGVGRDWLIQSGLIAASGSTTDRSGQASLPGQVEGARPQGAGEAAAGERSAGGCSGECAGCRCGSTEGEGE